METMAVYEEHPIGTYGLRAQEGFCWLAAGRPLAGLEGMAGLEFMETCPQPALLSASLWEGRLSLRLCLDQQELPRMLETLSAAGLEVDQPALAASLIHLQGPHFGERYGIAAAALESLAQAGVVPLALGAVVHSIFLVIEPHQAEAALAGLAQAFTAPD